MRLAEDVGDIGFVYGIDVSEGMLQKARYTADRLGIKNIIFKNSPLEKIDLDNNIADLVISNCTINHSSDKQTVWNEVFRILKEGGRFVVSDIYSINPVPEQFRNDPVAVSECWAGSVTRDEYLDQVHKAGFSSVMVLEESAPYEKGSVLVSSWTISGRK
jgi:ubiquinone/menaquinone biosynthesis C-methylase UbiE